jgi:hypothetical protein
MSHLPPLVTDANGTAWYRAADSSSAFTSQIEYADPGYFTPATQPPTREEPQPVTELDFRGEPDTSRYTDFMRYPLPPLVGPQQPPDLIKRMKYNLPNPATGRPTAYTRTTTMSKSTTDKSFLADWTSREQVTAVLQAQQFHQLTMEGGADCLTDNQLAMGVSYAELQRMLASDVRPSDINTQLRLIHDLAGGADARELGTAVHDWLDALDSGRVLFHQLPEFIKPYAENYQRVLADNGLVAVPEYSERIVLNDRGGEAIAGRIDRIYRQVWDDQLILGDLKTSKLSNLELDGVQIEYGIQLACYGYASLMLSPDYTTWSPMPEINQDYCALVHLPSDKPEAARVVPFDLYAGGEGMVTALDVREHRRTMPKRILTQSLPDPSEESIRFVQARQAIQNITSADDAIAVREQFSDVWSEELTEFGATCFDLLAATNEEN